jgi:sigma-E factor negative regulatory protein RseB
MAYAVEFLNYEGTLVHTHGGHASVLRIVHRVENGVVTERIASLDGAGREIIRDDRETTCILPDQEMVMVDQREDDGTQQSPLRQRVLPYAGIDSELYRVVIEGPGRAAGRRAQRLSVVPADGWRYGYRLWLDHATAMPLKVQVNGTDGEVIEQLLFASIDLPEQIDEERVRARNTTESFTWRHSEAAAAAREEGLETAWRARDLPPGFALMKVRHKTAGAATGEPVEQLVYSDGLATVSVFIDSAMADAPEDGAYRIGAANAYTLRRDGRLITAVGEVPGATVETIARSVHAGGAAAAR